MTVRAAVAAAAALALTWSAVGASSPSERRAILDALRHVGDLPDRVFVVRTLHVSGSWAWVEVNPQSRDGAQHYEPESALLHRDVRGWKVIDQPCAEEGCDPARELARLRRAHPQAPATLFAP